MKEWVQVPTGGLFCGECGQLVEKGAAVLMLVLPGLSRPKWRCAACADEPMPVFDPAARKREAPLTLIDDDGIERPVTSPMEQLGKLIGRLPLGFDVKQKASGA